MHAGGSEAATVLPHPRLTLPLDGKIKSEIFGSLHSTCGALQQSKRTDAGGGGGEGGTL